ncbi:MAG: ATP synthase F1 subunit delta [Bacteroidia bacterium]|nr:MAG: ATP synthase F1 subunit delta [Bacteroidia bacterium]
MNEGLIAGRYARALLVTLAGQDSLGEKCYREAKAVLPLLEENGELLKELLENVLLTEAQRVRGIAGVFREYAPSLETFATFLVQKGRGGYLLNALRMFQDMYRAQRGIVSVEMVSAVELGDMQTEALRSYVSARFGSQVELASRVDAQLIGGFQLQVADQLLDRSVRSELDAIAHQMV